MYELLRSYRTTSLIRNMGERKPGWDPAQPLGKREHGKSCEGLLPEGQGQDLALTVLHVPHSLDIG